MRGQIVTRAGQRVKARRRRGDDVAPVGSVTAGPAQVQVSCQVFVCVSLGFQWAQPGKNNIVNIVPPPTPAERRAIVAGMFGPAAMAPPNLPPQLDIMPCILGCQCVGLNWGAWTPNQIPQTLTVDVTVNQLGQPKGKTFTVTLSVPANVRQGVGHCQ
jgi:hypothetical protein